MFDLSFAELLVIAVVALVVLGPERLPRAARFTGLWVRRARAQWQSVRSEFERELAAEELKRNLDQARSAIRDADQQLRDTDTAARREVGQLRDDLGAAVQPGASPSAASPPAAAAVTPTDPSPSDDDATRTGPDGPRR